jgi:hypothetical protein
MHLEEAGIRVNHAQDTALKLYCKRCILHSLNLEWKYIKVATNSILQAVKEPLVSKL